jgi:TonB family protein
MKNIKVMNTKPEVTNEEIDSFMNFDSVLEKHRARKDKKNGRVTTGIIAGSVVIIGVLISWFVFHPDNNNAVTIEKAVPSAKQNSSNQVTDSVDNTLNTFEATQQVKPAPSAKKSDRKKSFDKSDEVQKNEDHVAEKIAAPVFIQAEPVAGYPDLYEYFSRELTYPASKMKDSVSGVVTVVFTISKEGRPEKIDIEQALGKEFDDEAIRVVKNMPNWNPATYNGKPMASRISLPLTFQIKKVK